MPLLLDLHRVLQSVPHRLVLVALVHSLLRLDRLHLCLLAHHAIRCRPSNLIHHKSCRLHQGDLHLRQEAPSNVTTRPAVKSRVRLVATFKAHLARVVALVELHSEAEEVSQHRTVETLKPLQVDRHLVQEALIRPHHHFVNPLMEPRLPTHVRNALHRMGRQYRLSQAL